MINGPDLTDSIENLQNLDITQLKGGLGGITITPHIKGFDCRSLKGPRIIVGMPERARAEQ
jgi:hypothetical protein